ncbi:MAG: fibronectin type III domain-containing protein [Saprospiraceae bacterium]|nr:fibronectin type III domain-containing protein [Saprospiraceae bacterium]
MLSWTASTDNVGVIGYDVYQDGIKINGGSVVSTSYNISGLSLNTPYTYLVRAIDAATNMSAASSSLLVTTLAAPDTEAPTAPTNLAVSGLTQSSLTLSWTGSTDNVGVAGTMVRPWPPAPRPPATPIPRHRPHQPGNPRHCVDSPGQGPRPKSRTTVSPLAGSPKWAPSTAPCRVPISRHFRGQNPQCGVAGSKIMELP